jgi:hypothetical protein
VSFDPNTLILSLVPSGIGFVLFVYGKKQQRWPHMIAGAALSVYPYLTETVLQMVLGGAAIGIAFWWALRQGY